MANTYFQFKQFTVNHDRCAMKVTTDGCLFGAWVCKGIGELGIGGKGSGRKSLLDIGTGCGLLSLMVAQGNELRIDAIEIDPAAVGQAKENIARSKWGDTIEVVNEDILQFQPQIEYDFIISNPPFYENELESPDQKKNLAHHSSGLKLWQLLDFVSSHLTQDGKFFLFLPYKRADEFNLLLNDGLFLHKKIIVKNSSLHMPSRIMIMGGKKEQRVMESIICIKNEQGYTDCFKNLLKEYYLQF